MRFCLALSPRLSLFSAIVLSLLLFAPGAAKAQDADAAIGQKLEAAIACINRLSERAFDSRARYVDWAGDKPKMKNKVRNVLGLYTIYETEDCAKGVAEAKQVQPAHAELDSASAAYVNAVQILEPMLKEADDYYEQENYKDDKFAKGNEMHGKLLLAWDVFRRADKELRVIVARIGDERQTAELARIEKQEGRSVRFHTLNTFLKAKVLVAAETDVEMQKMDLPKVQELLGAYETAVRDLETFAGKEDGKIDSFFIDSAKNVLVTAKALMRRVRDKEGFSEGDQMMLSQPGAGWMVEGSQPRLIDDFNKLVDNFNRM
ncbi:MAG: YiiG family protein [Aestuariivirga sp.]